MSLPSIGDVVGGKYAIVRLLGEGGMGAVYEAENRLTHKRVAIKWLRSELAPGSDAAARLLREAQAASRIRHSNVVDVYDVEREGQSIFLVMELLEGETLTRALARHDVSMPQRIALILPAMRGVAAAHRQGVVHRDIKPDNIFLAREDDHAQPVPKVVDFGISKLEERGRAQPSLTRTGSTLGTPLYMSYEQLAGDRTLDGRADVYAFGVILYEALTGRVPFDAESLPKLVVKVATELAVPPHTLCPDIPSSLSRLIMRALARQRDERTPNMETLIRELEPFATEAGFRAELLRAEVALPELHGPLPHMPEPGFLAQATQPDTALNALAAGKALRATEFGSHADPRASTLATVNAVESRADSERPYPFLGRTQHEHRFDPPELSPSLELAGQRAVIPTPPRSTPARLPAQGKRPRARWLAIGLVSAAAIVVTYRVLDERARQPVSAPLSSSEANAPAAEAPGTSPIKPTPPSAGAKRSDVTEDDWTGDRQVQVLVDPELSAVPDASPPLAPRPHVTKAEARVPSRARNPDAGLHAAAKTAPVAPAASTLPSQPANPASETPPADEAPPFRVRPPRSQEF